MMELKQLPQAIESEKAVLGAILLENCYERAAELLRPEMFYIDKHQIVFEAMGEMAAKGQSIDLVLLVDKLKGKVEAYDITSLTNGVVNSYHLIPHAKKIVEKWIKREQYRIAGNLLNGAQDESTDPFEVGEQAEKELMGLTQSLQTKDMQRVDAVCVDIVKELESLRHREHYLTGTPSGFETLDKVFLGWQPSDFIILAARPAVGKTAFSLNLASFPSFQNVPVAFFSLEMSAKQLVKRILSAKSEIHLSTLRAARLDDQQMNHLFVHGVQKVAGMSLYIDDTASITVGQIKSKLRKLKKIGVGLAIIDYLQLIKSTAGKNANRQQQIGEISRELKVAAKELELPIIALSQLSRDIEKRAEPIPQLSDLREAGDIEQDADIVMFLYGHKEKDVKADASLEREIFVKIAKHRNGSLETVQFDFDKPLQKFTDKGTGELKFLGTRNSTDDPF